MRVDLPANLYQFRHGKHPVIRWPAIKTVVPPTRAMVDEWAATCCPLRPVLRGDGPPVCPAEATRADPPYGPSRAAIDCWCNSPSNLLLRWFVELNADRHVWNPTTFTKQVLRAPAGWTRTGSRAAAGPGGWPRGATRRSSAPRCGARTPRHMSPRTLPDDAARSTAGRRRIPTTRSANGFASGSRRFLPG